MEHRFLGRSGFKVPVLGFGAGTFGGQGPLFSAWGSTDVAGARRIVDLCLDAGVNLFDTADVYSGGASESILGAALQGGDPRVPRTRATLAVAVPREAHRDECVRVRHRDDGTVEPTGPQGSHVLTSLLGADALAVIPRGEGDLPAGTEVDLEPL